MPPATSRSSTTPPGFVLCSVPCPTRVRCRQTWSPGSTPPSRRSTRSGWSTTRRPRRSGRRPSSRCRRRRHQCRGHPARPDPSAASPDRPAVAVRRGSPGIVLASVMACCTARLLDLGGLRRRVRGRVLSEVTQASSDGLSTSDGVPLGGRTRRAGRSPCNRHADTSYTGSGLAAQVRELTVTSPTTLSAPTVEGPTVGPLGDAPRCSRLPDRARGRPAPIPLTVDAGHHRRDTGPRRRRRGTPARARPDALSMSCEVLAGPVSVP